MGGSGGGGGSSGAVSYPTYMETVHNDWLDNTGADTITDSITDVMNAALGNSPFTTLSAYDPTTEVAAILAAPTDLETLVDLLSAGTGLDTLISSVLDESRITGSVTAFAADLDVQADAEIYPRFEAGMRDIGAVMSSAFVIGRANIASKLAREVSKYEGELRYKAWGDDAIRVIQLKLDYQKAVSQLVADANRISIVANKEEIDGNILLDEKDSMWDLGVFQHGTNVLAGISGGTAATGAGKPSTTQSVIGGAMSGAATGAMMSGGNPLAIGAGAFLGGVAGLF